MQPNNPRVVESDKYYLQLAMLLAKLWDNSHKFLALPEATRQAVVLAVVGYYQDVIADAGIWRSFVEAHKHLYGTPLPFYDCDGDDYIEYELNLQLSMATHTTTASSCPSTATSSGLPGSSTRCSTRNMKQPPRPPNITW